MIESMRAKVTNILLKGQEITEVLLEINHRVKRAANYNDMTGDIQLGDELLVNTTAASLGLGTGGIHFVIANISSMGTELKPGGHGMKLRYTPMQLKVSFTEEDGQSDSVYQSTLNLKNKTVIFGELHSMIPPLCCYLKHNSKKTIKITYIMTDHAALPLAFSKNIQELRVKGLIDCTITTGNAFGGDYECVNIYTALQTAADIVYSNVIVIAMGPGIVGTGTKYGFSGLEMGFYMDIVKDHNGYCLYIPRISYADKRDRHQGISHHSLTLLEEIIKRRINLVLPIMNKAKTNSIINQLTSAYITKKHKISFLDGSNIKEYMDFYNINTRTMGRGIDDDPIFYYTIGAVAEKVIR